MKQIISRGLGVFAVSLIATILAASGCSSGISSYCAGWAKCTGGTQKECEDNFTKEESQIPSTCKSKYDSTVDCAASNATCTTDTTGAKKYVVTSDKCNTQVADLLACALVNVSSDGGTTDSGK